MTALRLLPLFSIGCMAYPYTEQTIASTTATVSFGGWDLDPSVPIQVEVEVPDQLVCQTTVHDNGDGTASVTYAWVQTYAWKPLASTQSSTRAERGLFADGTDWFDWSATAIIPAAAWRDSRDSAGTLRKMARIRARDAVGNDLVIVRGDVSTCWSAHQSTQWDFYENCTATDEEGYSIARIYAPR